MRFTKADVETRSRGYGRPPYPTVNVKYYGHYLTDKVMEEFHCDEGTAEKALEYAYDSAREQFWEWVGEWAKELFGETVKVYSEGRSGGWLIVDGLPDIKTWDAILVSKWGRFAAGIRSDIEYRGSWEALREDIEANRWAEPGAELYNFVDTQAGPKCMVDLNAKLRETKAAFMEGGQDYDHNSEAPMAVKTKQTIVVYVEGGMVQDVQATGDVEGLDLIIHDQDNIDVGDPVPELPEEGELRSLMWEKDEK